MKYGIGRMQNKIYYNKESNKDKFFGWKVCFVDDFKTK